MNLFAAILAFLSVLLFFAGTVISGIGYRSKRSRVMGLSPDHVLAIWFVGLAFLLAAIMIG